MLEIKKSTGKEYVLSNFTFQWLLSKTVIFPGSKWNSLTFPWPWRNFPPWPFLTCGNHARFITREQVSERTTWSSQKLNIPLFRIASGQRTFYYRTVKLWNNLEPFLKWRQSVKSFKGSLTNQLLDNFLKTS